MGVVEADRGPMVDVGKDITKDFTRVAAAAAAAVTVSRARSLHFCAAKTMSAVHTATQDRLPLLTAVDRHSKWRSRTLLIALLCESWRKVVGLGL